MRAAFAAGFLALAATPAHAHWENTRWGMSETQVIAALRGQARTLAAGDRRPIPSARMEYRVGGEFSSGTLRLRVAFAFDGRTGGLVCISAQADEIQGPILRARLERLFGPPTERGLDPPTGGGIETLGWTTPDEIDLQIAPGRPVTLLQCARGV
ncbi:hypothetical protein GXW78_21225 [Roseomonas terrae]|jgi:hypothetical protein|uniref:Uncharacterized protein n=1 Tax=Neoroseomonas terrae TaxID=424799 RepID=A0ABS5EME1_9PROT|nr:hypothetical protein [Neoroseomonas terrae]MBR0652191.1 hypothetical protein [Neoroseomonas terrae]